MFLRRVVSPPDRSVTFVGEAPTQAGDRSTEARRCHEAPCELVGLVLGHSTFDKSRVERGHRLTHLDALLAVVNDLGDLLEELWNGL